ncbi:hypothetical protein PMM47T1_28336 [Pseudomonas sp. M47T1]|uniref:PAAR domain-containing protein n=1 Tax=unclassified Pseudomonas TaxID=196821 RepID=UPI00026086C0|nr:PAAR domain-containing protein [Pseudomonas sp. M47T1]EIK93176.1 hypothetical protein PMM47T1_28336 [Pseudomonas sp. M47T1]
MAGKPAARVTDPTACPLSGHGVNPIASGSPDVIFEGLAAARLNDPTACGGAIASGVSSTVFINGMNAATVGSVGSHGNSVTAGAGTIIIGDTHTPAAFVAPEPIVIPGEFNRTFQFQTDLGALAGLGYKIRSASGVEKVGTTCSAGKSSLFSTGQAAEEVTIYVDGM